MTEIVSVDNFVASALKDFVNAVKNIMNGTTTSPPETTIQKIFFEDRYQEQGSIGDIIDGILKYECGEHDDATDDGKVKCKLDIDGVSCILNAIEPRYLEFGQSRYELSERGSHVTAKENGFRISLRFVWCEPTEEQQQAAKMFHDAASQDKESNYQPEDFDLVWSYYIKVSRK